MQNIRKRMSAQEVQETIEFNGKIECDAKGDRALGGRPERLSRDMGSLGRCRADGDEFDEQVRRRLESRQTGRSR